MTTSGQYLKDILDVVPDYSIWKIYAINEELEDLKALLIDFDPRMEGSDLVVDLTTYKKERIKRLVDTGSIDEKIIHMQFWLGDRKIFEGFDHLDYGAIAREFSLKNDFKTKYIDNDLCTLLTD